MDGSTVRNAAGMLYGAYVGKIKFLDSDEFTLDYISKACSNLDFMIGIVNSINNKGHVCPNDICNKMDDNLDGSILYSISPLAFSDIFGLHKYDLDEVIKTITNHAGKDEKTQLLCIEFVHLIHDILWMKTNPEDILKILPELDVLESEVICSDKDKDVFFASLWSFIFSNDFITCYETASSLNNTNSDITGIACMLFGLYYGVDSIPKEWLDQTFRYCNDDYSNLPIL